VQPKGAIVILSLCIALVLAGCLPSTIQSEHGFVLARMQDGVPVRLPDDDPLYAQFQAEVLDDPHLGDLHRLFEDTTESFIATNTPHAAPQTVANHLVIVLDSEQVGVLRDITLRVSETNVPIELAVGLGPGATDDWTLARQQFESGVARLLLDLVGWDTRHADAEPGSLPYTPISEPTTPARALTVGFEAAMQAIHAQRAPDLLTALSSNDIRTPQEQELLLRYKAVPAGEYGAAANGSRSPEEMQRTPGAVATFFYRLLQTMNHFYCQRDMLWFVNYEPEDIPYAKILLAVNRMPHREQAASVETFILAYGETFPSERAAVMELAEQVFGPNQPDDATPGG
jgi:hypothetical protein